MAERLKTNQILFDGHIKGMDNALKASQKELTEVKTYLRMVRGRVTYAVPSCSP